jgi:protein LSM14
VRSFGTEGRKNGKDEYPPSDVVYEQIVFRGSDVKDLRIEEPAKEKAPPAMPQDPAIIGVSLTQPPYSGSVMQNFRMLNHYITESAKPCGYFPLPSF